LAVDFAPLTPAPSVVFQSANITSTSVNLRMTLSSDGTVYCGVFSLASKPASLSSIQSQGISGQSLSKNVSVTIVNLQPSTAYSVFCYSASTRGTVMTYATMLSTTKNVTTGCCKTVSVALSSLSLAQFSTSLYSVAISVGSLPSDSLSLQLTCNRTTGLLPASVTFSKSLSSFSSVVSIPSSCTTKLGVVYITASLTGASSGEYKLVYTKGSAVSIVSSSATPATPTLISTVFSAAGNTLVVTFNAATDKGKISQYQFYCSLLFNFTGMSSTQLCTWTSASQATVSLGSSATVTPGGSFNLLPSTVKAACTTDSSTCALWDYASAQSVVIGLPSSSLVPVVSISVPAVVSYCSNVVLDLSSSTGSGGRNWKSKSFQVSSANNITGLMLFLSNTYSLTPPTPIPVGLLSAGTYTIGATLCNFLGSCGTAVKTIQVISAEIPAVSIAGTSIRSIYRNTSLWIIGDASVTSCASGSSSRSNLVYSWSLSRYSNLAWVPVTGVTTISQSPSSYKLSSYTLGVAETYLIQMQVLYTVSQKSSQTSVQVIVLQSSIVAVIAGGSSRNVRVSDLITLDASGSYDPDYPVSSSLSFAWTCIQTAPTLNETCGLNLPTVTTSATINPTASAAEIGTTSSFTVSVYDSSRIATQTVSVTLQSSFSPKITLTSYPTTKFNPSAQLTIGATISYSGAGTASWSVDAPYTIDLQSVALTTVSTSVSAASTSVNYNLVIGPNSLAANNFFTFELSCTIAGASTFTTVSVQTNGPPQPGTFSLSPSRGSELTDTFTMTASQWQDADLPLYFQFGFYSQSGIYQITQTLSQASYGSTLLPGGTSTSNYSVSCVVNIFDSYFANSSTSSSVQVLRLSISTSQVSSLISQQLSGLSGDANGLSQALSVGSSLLNAVSCSAAPDCTSLNRNPCSTTADTCGSCISDALGDAGDHNSQCLFLATISSAAQRLSSISCTNSSSCSLWESCVNSVCVLESKSCVGNCSGVGTCKYTNIYTGNSVVSCKNGDPTCAASCSCASGYTGSSCSLTTSDYESKVATRYQLLVALYNLTSIQDPIESSVSGWLVQLQAIVQNTDELSSEMVDYISDIAQLIISASLDLQLHYSTVSDIQDVIDAVAVIEASSSSSRRLLADADQLSATTRRLSTYPQLDLAQSYALFVLEFMVFGQNDVTSVNGQFSLLCSYGSFSDGILAVSTVLSTEESYYGVLADSISISNSVGLDSTKVFVIRANAVNYGTLGSLFYSNPVIVWNNESAACEGCGLSLELQNINSVTYPNITVGANYTTMCFEGVVLSHVYPCSNGNMTVSCNGTYNGFISSQCPYNVTQPSCAALADDALYNGLCTTDDFSSDSTTCSCTLDSKYQDSTGSFQFVTVSSFAGVYPDSTYDPVPVTDDDNDDETTTTIHHKAKPTILSVLTLGGVIGLFGGCFVLTCCCVVLGVRSRKKSGLKPRPKMAKPGSHKGATSQRSERSQDAGDADQDEGEDGDDEQEYATDEPGSPALARYDSVMIAEHLYDEYATGDDVTNFDNPLKRTKSFRDRVRDSIQWALGAGDITQTSKAGAVDKRKSRLPQKVLASKSYMDLEAVHDNNANDGDRDAFQGVNPIKQTQMRAVKRAEGREEEVEEEAESAVVLDLSLDLIPEPSTPLGATPHHAAAEAHSHDKDHVPHDEKRTHFFPPNPLRRPSTTPQSPTTEAAHREEPTSTERRAAGLLDNSVRSSISHAREALGGDKAMRGGGGRGRGKGRGDFMLQARRESAAADAYQRNLVNDSIFEMNVRTRMRLFEPVTDADDEATEYDFEGKPIRHRAVSFRDDDENESRAKELTESGEYSPRGVKLPAGTQNRRMSLAPRRVVASQSFINLDQARDDPDAARGGLPAAPETAVDAADDGQHPLEASIVAQETAAANARRGLARQRSSSFYGNKTLARMNSKLAVLASLSETANSPYARRPSRDVQEGKDDANDDAPQASSARWGAEFSPEETPAPSSGANASNAPSSRLATLLDSDDDMNFGEIDDTGEHPLTGLSISKEPTTPESPSRITLRKDTSVPMRPTRKMSLSSVTAGVMAANRLRRAPAVPSTASPSSSAAVDVPSEDTAVSAEANFTDGALEISLPRVVPPRRPLSSAGRGRGRGREPLQFSPLGSSSSGNAGVSVGDAADATPTAAPATRLQLASMSSDGDELPRPDTVRSARSVPAVRSTSIEATSSESFLLPTGSEKFSGSNPFFGGKSAEKEKSGYEISLPRPDRRPSVGGRAGRGLAVSIGGGRGAASVTSPETQTYEDSRPAVVPAPLSPPAGAALPASEMVARIALAAGRGSAGSGGRISLGRLGGSRPATAPEPAPGSAPALAAANQQLQQPALAQVSPTAAQLTSADNLPRPSERPKIPMRPRRAAPPGEAESATTELPPPETAPVQAAPPPVPGRRPLTVATSSRDVTSPTAAGSAGAGAGFGGAGSGPSSGPSTADMVARISAAAGRGAPPMAGRGRGGRTPLPFPPRNNSVGSPQTPKLDKV
jgi:hypothetical protein